MMKTTTPWTCLTLRLFSIAGILSPTLLLPSGTAFAASLSVSSTQVQETGGTARVCVGLSAGSENVVATQNDLVWDANCASLVDKCEANSAHGKQLMSNQKGTGQLAAIVISLQDTNKIPDGNLYCCTFRAELSNAGSCCAVGVQGASASDPEGKALSIAGRGGQICLASNAGSGGGLQDGNRQQQDVVSADLGDTNQRQAPPQGVNQPAGQQAPANAGSGNTVASGGVGGVPGGVGGVPGGQPGAPVPPGQVQPGQVAQPQEVGPGSAPAAGTPQQQVAAEGTPTGPPAVAAPARTSAPAVAPPRDAAPAAKPAATMRASSTAKAAAAAPAAPEKSSGCNCEITPSGVGFEASAALLAIPLLLWARRRRL